MKIKVLLLLCLISVFFWVTGCEEESKEVLIGVSVPQTGDMADLGIETVRALEIYTDKINAEGGLLEKPIKLLIEDDQCDPEISASIAQKFLDEKVSVVLGYICDDAAKAALDVYREAKDKIPVMSPCVEDPQLTLSGKYRFFSRTIATEDAMARFQIEFALAGLHVTSLAIVYENTDYGKKNADYAEEFVNQDYRGEVILKQEITIGANDYSDAINKIVESGADIIIFEGQTVEASKFITQLKNKGVDLPFLCNGKVDRDEFIKLAGNKANGTYLIQPLIDFQSNTLANQAKQEYMDKFNEEPDSTYYYAYSAIMALTNIINLAGNLEYKHINAKLKTEYTDTPIGKICFDGIGDIIRDGFAPYHIENGESVKLQ